MITDELSIANNFTSRFIGLMGRKYLDKKEGLLLVKCNSIHSFFMKFPMDVVYLSENMDVLHIETIKPWKIGKRVRKAANVLELAVGSANGVFIGDKILLE
nr:DUF192 domain-containing protein [Sedimentibacter acidaminivorans]